MIFPLEIIPTRVYRRLTYQDYFGFVPPRLMIQFWGGRYFRSLGEMVALEVRLPKDSTTLQEDK
jgi:hypothetical protein